MRVEEKGKILSLNQMALWINTPLQPAEHVPVKYALGLWNADGPSRVDLALPA